MNPAIVRAPRIPKHPVFADFAARDIKRRLTKTEDHLRARWEQIALEPRA